MSESRLEGLGLYDLLIGGFLTEGDVQEYNFENLMRLRSEDRLKKSIVENLTLILKTPRGSIAHLPDFGLPDIRQIYFEKMSLDPVLPLIRDTVTKYEPRLSNVKVEVPSGGFDRASFHVTLKISARIRGTRSKELLFTELSSGGLVRVYFDRKQAGKHK